MINEIITKNSQKQSSELSGALTLYESNVSGDISPYNKLISDLVSRSSLSSSLKYMCGIIPTTTPEGKIPVSTSVFVGKDSQNLTVQETLRILQVADSSTFVEDGDITSAGGAEGTVIHVEDGQILIHVTVGTFISGEDIDNVNPYVGSKSAVTGVYTATHGVGSILRDYVGEYSTANGENLGNTEEFREVDYKIFLESVETKTKKLRSGYTKELLQDAFAIYGVEYSEKLREVLTDIIDDGNEQKVFDFMITNAVQNTDLVLTNSYGANTSIKAVFEDIYARINSAIGRIGTITRINGDFCVTASSNVVSALHTLEVIKPIEGLPENSKVAGRMKNGVVVIEDPYSFNDYFVVSIVNGEQSAVIYSPYTYGFIEAVDEKTLETYLAVMIRAGVINSPLATKTNAQGKNEMMEMTVVDFSGVTNF